MAIHYEYDSQVKQSKKEKKVRGAEVLANTYFRNAYPKFEVTEDGKILLQLNYNKKDMYLQQTVHKQDTLVKFLKKITKGKDFILEGLLFEEGKEKIIYEEMEQEIEITNVLKGIEEVKAIKKAHAFEKTIQEAEERESREEKETIKKEQSKGTGAKILIDPFGGGLLCPR